MLPDTILIDHGGKCHFWKIQMRHFWMIFKHFVGVFWNVAQLISINWSKLVKNSSQQVDLQGKPHPNCNFLSCAKFLIPKKCWFYQLKLPILCSLSSWSLTQTGRVSLESDKKQSYRHLHFHCKSHREVETWWKVSNNWKSGWFCQEFEED